MTTPITAWEDEGGAVVDSPPRPGITLTGTPNQVEWAEGIRRRVGLEFDRVAASIRSVAVRQTGAKRLVTEALLGILEEKRAAVMRNERAGYYIHDWSDIGDRVRQMVVSDERFKTIRIQRPAHVKQAPLSMIKGD